MAITIYLILSWLTVASLIFDKKGVGNRGVVFVFMVTTFVNTHILLIFSDPIKKIDVSYDPKVYIGFVVFRSMFIPLLFTYIINELLKTRGFVRTGLIFLLAIMSFVLTEKLNLWLDLYRYIDWSIFNSVSYLTGLLLVQYFVLKWVRNRGRI